MLKNRGVVPGPVTLFFGLQLFIFGGRFSLGGNEQRDTFCGK